MADLSTPVVDRISALRREMAAETLDAYLVPSTDPHQSEYVPDHWQRRPFVSGFTGSAGDVVVTPDAAGLWTDSRYFLQAEGQLQGSGIALYRVGTPDVADIPTWLGKNLSAGSRVGIDPQVVSADRARDLESAMARFDIDILWLDRNLVDAIWEDQPALPRAPVHTLAESSSGESLASKLERLRAALGDAGTNAHVLATLDAIAWALNLRGGDVDYNPVFIAYMLVTSDAAELYVDEARVTPEIEAWLSPHVSTRPYAAFEAELQERVNAGSRFWVDGNTTSQWLARKIGPSEVHRAASPVSGFKARKNSAELAGFRAAHVDDGVAMVRFLRWLEEHVPEGGITEWSAARRLQVFREGSTAFVGPSFPSISGYGPHGAIVHYAVTPESSLPIGTDNLYLIDSGGQYRWGTTDVTRTLCFGTPSAAQREMYTRVLKGHIALSTLIFPAGASGQQVEAFARRPLWEIGRNFLHGTGHGIGHYLNVHEGPIGFSPRASAPLESGNVISNEPGYYEDGEYGIRIENLVVVKEHDSGGGPRPFLGFETLTLCPIALNLVEASLLTEEERSWLNDYHRGVREALTPRLEGNDARWLHANTRSL